MNSESIYAILASKPHNPHYLKRYLKFIEWCKQNPTNDDYTEDHHICPKAVDLFPEYISFRNNPWNKITLSMKQHLISHIMLWKAYGDGSQSKAMRCFFNLNEDTNKPLTGRKIPTVIEIRYKVKAMSSARKSQLGKSNYRDKNGKRYYLETSSPLIEELGLINVTANIEPSEFRIDANKRMAEFWTNRARYATPNGVYHGSYLKDDPIITEFSLVPYRTEAQIEQNASRVFLATEAKLGTQIYNNGVEEKFLREPIDSTWVLGRLERSDEWEVKRKASVAAKIVGAKTYNNGFKNLFIQPGEPIPEGFILGMKPQKIREFSFTNGVETIRCSMEQAPEGYTLTRYFKKV